MRICHASLFCSWNVRSAFIKEIASSSRLSRKQHLMVVPRELSSLVLPIQACEESLKLKDELTKIATIEGCVAVVSSPWTQVTQKTSTLRASLHGAIHPEAAKHKPCFTHSHKQTNSNALRCLSFIVLYIYVKNAQLFFLRAPAQKQFFSKIWMAEL